MELAISIFQIFIVLYMVSLAGVVIINFMRFVKARNDNYEEFIRKPERKYEQYLKDNQDNPNAIDDFHYSFNKGD